MRLQLIRQSSTNQGTFGAIHYENQTWFTCERPWLENASGISCIPKGVYNCQWTLSPRLKKFTYEVLAVPNRTGIRVHSANFPEQLLGCIALGEKIGTINGKQAILSSTSAVRQFNQALNGQLFQMEIE